MSLLTPLPLPLAKLSMHSAIARLTDLRSRAEPFLLRTTCPSLEQRYEGSRVTMRRTVFAGLALLLSVVCFAPRSFAIPVFPGAVGFGTETSAGRGGAVFKVNTLSDSSTVAADPNFTTLREALQAPGARTVIFEVSGTITLTEPILINSPFLTVAGQTAPSPGILVRGYSIDILTHDVLIQHLAVRPGSDNPLPRNCVDRVNLNNRDSFRVLTLKNELTPDTYKVVLDHVSGSWTTDQLVSVYGDHATAFVEDVTISNSLFAEPLHNSIHDECLPHGRAVAAEGKRVGVDRHLQRGAARAAQEEQEEHDEGVVTALEQPAVEADGADRGQLVPRAGVHERRRRHAPPLVLDRPRDGATSPRPQRGSGAGSPPPTRARAAASRPGAGCWAQLALGRSPRRLGRRRLALLRLRLRLELRLGDGAVALSIFGARLRRRVPQYGHSVMYGLTSAPPFLQTTKRSGELAIPNR